MSFDYTEIGRFNILMFLTYTILGSLLIYSTFAAYDYVMRKGTYGLFWLVLGFFILVYLFETRRFGVLAFAF